MRKSKKLHPGNLLLEFILLLASLLVVIPLLVVIFGSLKSQAEAMRFDLALPSELHLENFVKVAQKGNVPLAFKNSMIVTAAVVLVVTLCTSLSSFVIARRNDRFSSFLSGYYSLGLIVPWAIVPTVLLLKILHIQNTQLGLIAILIALNIPWGSFIITNFINTIPRELDEAAAIDGCGPLTLFFRVVLPLLKHVLRTRKVRGFDICEISPRFDQDNTTANLGAVIIFAVINTLCRMNGLEYAAE